MLTPNEMTLSEVWSGAQVPRVALLEPSSLSPASTSQRGIPDGYSLATRGKAFVFVYIDADGVPRMSKPMPLDSIEQAAREHRDAQPADARRR